MISNEIFWLSVFLFPLETKSAMKRGEILLICFHAYGSLKNYTEFRDQNCKAFDPISDQNSSSAIQLIYGITHSRALSKHRKQTNLLRLHFLFMLLSKMAGPDWVITYALVTSFTTTGFDDIGIAMTQAGELLSSSKLRAGSLAQLTLKR